MNSLIEEPLHEHLLLCLLRLQIFDFSAFGGDAIVSFIHLVLRSRSVFIVVLLILRHVHGAHLAVLKYEL
jgi:hypothetical protein